MLEDSTVREKANDERNEQNSQTAQFKHMTAIESKNQKISSLETSLRELNEEKESAMIEIANLRNELKLQEQHFAKQLKAQDDYNAQFAEHQL